MKVNQKLNAAIYRLADRLENGHLLASMGGEELLIAAADEIDRLRAEVAHVSHFKVPAKDALDALNKWMSYCDLSDEHLRWITRWAANAFGLATGDVVAMTAEEMCKFMNSNPRYEGIEFYPKGDGITWRNLTLAGCNAEMVINQDGPDLVLTTLSADEQKK